MFAILNSHLFYLLPYMRAIYSINAEIALLLRLDIHYGVSSIIPKIRTVMPYFCLLIDTSYLETAIRYT